MMNLLQDYEAFKKHYKISLLDELKQYKLEVSDTLNDLIYGYTDDSHVECVFEDLEKANIESDDEFDVEFTTCVRNDLEHILETIIEEQDMIYIGNVKYLLREEWTIGNAYYNNFGVDCRLVRDFRGELFVQMLPKKLGHTIKDHCMLLSEQDYDREEFADTRLNDIYRITKALEYLGVWESN